MVKFIGGPSINAYKNYNNHRIARPGQFRMPRNYGSYRSRTTVIVNDSHCHCNQPSRFMQFMYAMPMITDLLGGLLDLFKPKTPIKNDDDNIFAKPITTTTTFKPQTTTVVAEDEDVEDGEDVKVVNDDADDDTPTTPTATGKLTFSTTTTPAQQEPDKTVEVNVKKGIKSKNNQSYIEYQGWKTLIASYKSVTDGKTIPFSDKNFREYFREQHLNGKDIWNVGTQHFPKTITYNGTTYEFDHDTFKNPLDQHCINDKGSVSTANMQKIPGENTPASTTKTYKGTITIDGKYGITVTGASSEEELKRQLTDRIKNNSTLTPDQKDTALKKLEDLKAEEENPASGT